MSLRFTVASLLGMCMLAAGVAGCSESSTPLMNSGISVQPSMAQARTARDAPIRYPANARSNMRPTTGAMRQLESSYLQRNYVAPTRAIFETYSAFLETLPKRGRAQRVDTSLSRAVYVLTGNIKPADGRGRNAIKKGQNIEVYDAESGDLLEIVVVPKR